MSKVEVSIPQLSMLYVSGISFADNLMSEVDIMNTEMKKIEESGVFEGKNGEQCRELFKELAKVNQKLATDIGTINVFLDRQIGASLDLNNLDHYSEVSDQAKALIKKRLKK